MYLSESTEFHRFFSGLWEVSPLYRDFCQSEKEKGKKMIFSPGFGASKIVALDAVSLLKPDVVEIPFDDIIEMEWWLDSIQQFSSDSEIMISFEDMDEEESISAFSYFTQSYRLEEAITWIGLHRQLETMSEDNEGGRSQFLVKHGEILTGRKLWLCGVYKNPYNELTSVSGSAFFKGLEIVGADSSKPWRISITGRKISEFSPYPNPFDFLQKDISSDILEFVADQFREYSKFVTTNL